MEMTLVDPVILLKKLITDQEQHILTGFSQDMRWAVLELSRASDALFWETVSDHKPDYERQYLYQFGWTKSLSLFIGEHCLKPGVPLTPSTPRSQLWAESIMTLCGKLGLCEMLLEYERFGLGELTLPKNDEIHFKISVQNPGIEAIERDEFEYLSELAVEMDASTRSRLLPMRAEIMKKMSGLVQPWRQYYIQYQTEPDIDRFYQQFGLLWSHANCLGADSFPDDVNFGGQPFGLFKSTIVTLAGFALKHFDFCQALLINNCNMELRNLLTIYCHRNDLCDDFAAALDITSQEASQIVSLLTLTPLNKAAHVLLPRNYSPPLIQISEESIINSVSGNLSNSPFLFLLTELKNRYPKDWEYAIGLREDIFRKELYQLFPGEPFITIDRPVKIKVEGQVLTDIDAIIFDKRTGTLCLFQLKWQDFFSSSMQKRESKKKNLMRTANAWIECVNNWLVGRDCNTIMSRFSLDASSTKINRKLLFVIGRNFTQFSGDEQPDDRAAWGMWPQVIRLVKKGLENKTLDTTDPLGWLYSALHGESTDNKNKVAVAGQKFRLGNYNIVLEHSE